MVFLHWSQLLDEQRPSVGLVPLSIISSQLWVPSLPLTWHLTGVPRRGNWFSRCTHTVAMLVGERVYDFELWGPLVDIICKEVDVHQPFWRRFPVPVPNYFHSQIVCCSFRRLNPSKKRAIILKHARINFGGGSATSMLVMVGLRHLIHIGGGLCLFCEPAFGWSDFSRCVCVCAHVRWD